MDPRSGLSRPRTVALLLTTTVLCAVSWAAVGRAAPSREGTGGWRSSFPVNKATLSSTGRNPYFILELGSRLRYAHGKASLTITVLDETKLVDGVKTRVVEEREEKNGQITEVSMNFFAIDPATHDLYYFGEDSAEYANGKVVSREGSWLAGERGASFGLMLPGSSKVGDRFYQEMAPGVAMDRAVVTAIGSERSVPAGAFKGCLEIEETSPLEAGKSRKWYAPGVGLIRDDEFVLVAIKRAGE
jgi:hypothetical protein